MKTTKLIVLITFAITMSCSAQINTTLKDFFLPGSQPNESGSFNAMPNNCGCHEYIYNQQHVDPMYNWMGSMMSQSARDPLYFAALAIANQDADSSGDLCIRCHAPRGWLSGRSTPTDGSALTDNDREGIYCAYCHRAVKPSPIGINPYLSDTDYTNSTYYYDSLYLQTISDHIPDSSGNGMYVIDNDNTRRGPFTDADANHAFRYSPFHSDAYFCGTCHDVSNPVFTLQSNGTYQLNNLNEASPSFNPYTMFPVERTFSEWKMSQYNTTAGVVAPQFGGNKDTVRTCQDCHLRDVTGPGCNKNGAPIRDDLPLHDMTGGNTFIPGLVASLFPSEVNSGALTYGTTRATYMLQHAATLEYADPVFQQNNILLKVIVINETGHKLPSGYPEGRRMWLNVIAYDDEANENIIFESGAYDYDTGVLTHDDYAKIYEVEPGHDGTPSFDFVLNNEIIKDNRIPPRGFTNANFETIQSPPVDYTYKDGQYSDTTEYLLPSETKYFTVNLFYQSTSKEYIEFLRDNNSTDTTGQSIYRLWNNSGKSAPVLMQTTGNSIPLPVELSSFTAKVFNNSVQLNWITQTEIKNFGFDIECSDNKSFWSKIGFVHGNGNSNSPIKYSFIDDKPVGQKLNYRLKQIDNDGAFEYSMIISVNLGIPDKYTLFQNYPNPFNPTTTIKYQLPANCKVVLKVFNVLGNEVATLLNQTKEAGRYEVTWDASKLSSGIYFYRLQTRNFIQIKKMILLK